MNFSMFCLYVANGKGDGFALDHCVVEKNDAVSVNVHSRGSDVQYGIHSADVAFLERLRDEIDKAALDLRRHRMTREALATPTARETESTERIKRVL